MSDWLEKAKQAAKDAAEGAKNLAEKAKNADYGQMLDKTKAMAKDAVDETKKAADSFRSSVTPPVERPTQVQPTEAAMPAATVKEQITTVKPDMAQYIQQIEQIEALLADLKKKLQQE